MLLKWLLHWSHYYKLTQKHRVPGLITINAPPRTALNRALLGFGSYIRACLRLDPLPE